MNIILTALGVAFLIMIIFFLLLALSYIFHFHMHPCKHCGRRMKYKGFKNDNEEGHFLFHCPHCGAWEQTPKNVFIREL